LCKILACASYRVDEERRRSLSGSEVGDRDGPDGRRGIAHREKPSFPFPDLWVRDFDNLTSVAGPADDFIERVFIKRLAML
jgi:hypothetical protein